MMVSYTILRHIAEGGNSRFPARSGVLDKFDGPRYTVSR